MGILCNSTFLIGSSARNDKFSKDQQHIIYFSSREGSFLTQSTHPELELMASNLLRYEDVGTAPVKTLRERKTREQEQ